MTKQFIDALKQTCIYQRKEDTTSSYYRQAGTTILPERISINRKAISTIENLKSSHMHKPIGYIAAHFKKNETSPLKLHKPYKLRTNIWLNEYFSSIIGYGIIGMSNEQGKINRKSEKSDLIILKELEPNWKIIEIQYFAGMSMELDAILKHLIA